MAQQAMSAFLMIISQFHPAIGGAERECQNLSRKLIEMGHSAIVLTEFRDGLPPFETIEHIPVYRKIRGWHLFELTYMISVFIFLWRNRGKFTHIVCFGLYLFTVPAVLFGVCMGRKVFVRLECSGAFGDFQRIAKLKFGKCIIRCAQWAHTMIAISSEIEQELAQHGFSHKKIIRIPNSVDTEKFTVSAQSKASGAARISFVGRLDRQKGIDILLDALKILFDKAVPFKACIVGDGPCRQDLMQQAERLSLSEFITFTGLQQDTAPFYRQADILVLPSRQEGLPLVLLEGMASGLGIVATSAGGISEVLNPGGTEPDRRDSYTLCAHGILVQIENPLQLAAALQFFIENEAVREQLGLAARKYVENNYSINVVIKEYLQLTASF